MKPGDFYATCRKWQTDGKTRCDETFHSGDALADHMKGVHSEAYRENRRLAPKMEGARKRPWNAPAVKEQPIPPGTEFTHKGYQCQVVGAVSATRTRFLTWFPEGKEPTAKTARRVVGQTEPGRIMWEITAPTWAVLDAVNACDS